MPKLGSVTITKNEKSDEKRDTCHAIGQHILDNHDCAENYSEDCFKVICKARSLFHLEVLESVHIKTKRPVLCRQKRLVFSRGLVCNLKMNLSFRSIPTGSTIPNSYSLTIPAFHILAMHCCQQQR